MYCSRCAQDKPDDEFYESQPQVHRGWCAGCYSKAALAHRLRYPLQRILADTRRWSRQRHLGYNLTLNHLEEVWASQGGCCAISRVAFSDVNPPKPPSVRLIDPTQGFLCGNVQLVIRPVGRPPKRETAFILIGEPPAAT